jgi:hypothetical protein
LPYPSLGAGEGSASSYLFVVFWVAIYANNNEAGVAYGQLPSTGIDRAVSYYINLVSESGTPTDNEVKVWDEKRFAS